jgi:hypothetical protein
MAFGAMVILLAAGGLLSASSSKGAAIAGIYTSTGVDATYVLTLRADAERGPRRHTDECRWARRCTSPEIGRSKAPRSSSTWRVPATPELRSVVTLVPNGTTLGVQDVAGRDPRFRGLSFVNNGTAQPASDVRPSSPTSPVGEHSRRPA